jgi:ribosome-binding factor A
MAKPSYKRSARVSDQMKEEIADILMRKVRDPRIGFVTVTDVAVSDDLRNAKVYVSILGGERAETLKALEHATAYIRSELGRRMRMKFMPELLFRYDEAAERGAHIMELLQHIDELERKDENGGERS